MRISDWNSDVCSSDLDRFLGHVERCRVLLHLVDGTGETDPAESYRIIRDELDAYARGLEDKAEIVALNKCDALAPEEIEERRAALAAAAGIAPDAGWTISGAAGLNVRPLRSEERRGGKEGVSPCRSRWAPCHYK